MATASETAKDLPVIEQLLMLHAEHAKAYNDPVNITKRKLYKKEHPTKIMVFKCMDGRLNLPYMCQIEPGIVDPMREMGAKFNIGWGHFQDILMGWMKEAMARHRNRLGIVTYHFSRTSKHLGCRAFDYNDQAALEYSVNFKQQIDYRLGDKGRGAGIFTVLWGIETDLGALVLHGANRQRVDLADEVDTSQDYWFPKLQNLYPYIPDAIILDLIPLVQGNIMHIAEMRLKGPIPGIIDHAEFGLAFGRGLNWLHKPNAMFIVGPFNPNPVEPISGAGRLLLENIRKERVDPSNGIALMTSVPYIDDGITDTGFEAGMAEAKALENSKIAYNILCDEHNGTKDLVPYLQRLTFTINMDNWEINVLQRS